MGGRDATLTGGDTIGATLRAFVVLSRPHFLFGGLILFALGAVTAPHVDVAMYVVAQLMVTSAQLTAHYVNEYSDVAADRLVANRTFFSGGSGVLTAGRLQPRTALLAALVTSVIALGAAAVVAVETPAAAAIGVASLGVSWAYSMPPVRLLGTGWGEAATSLVVAVAVPFIGALSQGTAPGKFLSSAVLVLFAIHMAMILAFELPDLETDAAAGKRVIAVRIGEPGAIALIGGFLGVAVIAGAVSWITGWLPTPAALAVLPATLPAAATVHLSRTSHHGYMTAAAVLTLAVAATGFLLGAPMAGAN